MQGAQLQHGTQWLCSPPCGSSNEDVMAVALSTKEWVKEETDLVVAVAMAATEASGSDDGEWQK